MNYPMACPHPGCRAVADSHKSSADTQADLQQHIDSEHKPATDAKEKIFDWTAETDIEKAVFEAIGAASVCWENMSGTGVFDSTRAKKIGEELVEHIQSKQPIY